MSYYVNAAELGFTYGLEIENTCQDRISLKNGMENAFGCRATIEHVHSGNAYNVNGWLIENDGSVNGCEVVSPILTYDKMISELPIVLNIIQSLNGSADRTCGFHIHIGHPSYHVNNAACANGFTIHTLKNLIKLVTVRDTIIRGACRVTYRERWCKKYTDEFVSASQKCDTIAELKRAYYSLLGDGDSYGYYNSARYYLLNLHCLFGDCANGTIEFRLFNGTVNYDKIKAYVDLCSALVHMAETQNRISDARESRERAEEENPKYSFRTFVNKLGLIGDEYKTTRQVLRMSLQGISNAR